jgi:hypothetical protein
MANYKFKGVSLSTILSQEPNWGFTNVPKYAGLGFSTTTFENSKALPTGYSVDNVDISNTARASITVVDSTRNINIPSGVKSFRVIARGGGVEVEVEVEVQSLEVAMTIVFGDSLAEMVKMGKFYMQMRMLRILI